MCACACVTDWTLADGKEYVAACTDNSTASACGANHLAIAKISVKPPDARDKLAKLQGARGGWRGGSGSGEVARQSFLLSHRHSYRLSFVFLLIVLLFGVAKSSDS